MIPSVDENRDLVTKLSPLVALMCLLLGWIAFEWSHFGSSVLFNVQGFHILGLTFAFIGLFLLVVGWAPLKSISASKAPQHIVKDETTNATQQERTNSSNRLCSSSRLRSLSKGEDQKYLARTPTSTPKQLELGKCPEYKVWTKVAHSQDILTENRIEKYGPRREQQPSESPIEKYKPREEPFLSVHTKVEELQRQAHVQQEPIQPPLLLTITSPSLRAKSDRPRLDLLDLSTIPPPSGFSRAVNEYYGESIDRSSPVGNVQERLKLNDLYLFHVPVNELVRYFGCPENTKSLDLFYEKILANVDSLSASVAADLIRLPVKACRPHFGVTRALCDRILHVPIQSRNLTSMQIALICWSLAKTPECIGFGQRQGELNCFPILASLAEETLMRVKEFEPLSIANLLWACGKLRYKNEKLLKTLAEVASSQLDVFNAQNIANTYWAIGTLEAAFTALTPRLTSDTAIHPVVSILTQKLPSFNSQAVANFVWACAKLQWNVPLLLRVACHAAVQIHKNFKPQEIANFMWGIAKLGFIEGAFAVELFAKRAAVNLRQFNSQEVSNAYWALGTLEIRGTELTPLSLCIPIGTISSTSSYVLTPAMSTTSSSLAFSSRAASAIDLGVTGSITPSTQETLEYGQTNSCSVVDYSTMIIPRTERQPQEKELLAVLLHKMEQFNSQAVANFIWACGKLQWKSLELCAAARHIIQRNIRHFRPQNTANVLWALAKLKVNDPDLIRFLVDSAVSRLDEFNTQEVANVYWAIGTLELRETELTPGQDSYQASEHQRQSAVCRAIKSKLPMFKPQEIANFLWACARLRWRPLELLDEATATASRCVGRFKPQEIGNLVWALAKLNYRHVDLLRTMCDYAAINIQQFTPQNIANIYWAVGSLTFSQTLLSTDHPSPEFLSALIGQLYKFNDQEMSNFVWACGRLRWEVKEIISTASKIVVQQSRRFRRKELLNLQWAFKKLGHHDIVEILEAALDGDTCCLPSNNNNNNKGWFSPIGVSEDIQ